MSWFSRKPEPLTPEEIARREDRRRRLAREEAEMDSRIEAEQRAQIPCLDCEIGEPHVCERAYWQQRVAHQNYRECADPECICHPEKCECCGQNLDAPRPVNA